MEAKDAKKVSYFAIAVGMGTIAIGLRVSNPVAEVATVIVGFGLVAVAAVKLLQIAQLRQ